MPSLRMTAFGWTLSLPISELWGINARGSPTVASIANYHADVKLLKGIGMFSRGGSPVPWGI